MHRRQTATLALWALLLLQADGLPLGRWLGLSDVCSMGCASEGRACCCFDAELPAAHRQAALGSRPHGGGRGAHAHAHADEHQHSGGHTHAAEQPDPGRRAPRQPVLARADDACAAASCAVLEASRLVPQTTPAGSRALLGPPASRPALDLRYRSSAGPDQYNPATLPRSPPRLSGLA